VKREKWTPNKKNRICSEHFATGRRSNNPLAPNYVPTIFPQLESPAKRRLEKSAITFERRQETKRKRVCVQQCSVTNVLQLQCRKDSDEATEHVSEDLSAVGKQVDHDSGEDDPHEDSVVVAKHIEHEDSLIVDEYMGPIGFVDTSCLQPTLRCDFCDERAFRCQETHQAVGIT